MKLNIFQVDAFASRVFTGNPAAVIPLERWLEDNLLQKIAQENNLSETVFFVRQDNGYKIRWFTPLCEVKLCGHATLAAAYIIFTELDCCADEIVFSSLSGRLKVSRHQQWLTLNFPAQPPVVVDTPAKLVQGLGKTPQVCLASEDYIAVFADEAELAAMTPDSFCLSQLDKRGVIVTAPSSQYDFVARFFAPKLGIIEDPVTGSAFTQLMPYWALRLANNKLHARQVSQRGGEVTCELVKERVYLSGTAALYLKGEIMI